MTDRDEVDQIVGAWHRVRPDLDLAPLEVMSRITRIARLLDKARRRSFERHGLETWEFDVLAALRREGDPYSLSPGALVAQTLVTSGTMTNRVDRLVARGLVTREPDPTDRRGVVVSATVRGLDQVDAAMTDLIEVERALLGALTTADQARLTQTLRALLSSLHEPRPE
ncbi:MarR family transcriptional regulator TamR [Rarobacter faecitabidus]|uniref:MarR family transcriptional regulator n=1 Tax=Rarobacter faecitabidus TaxID=13243 RepID=A0A542ZTX2_RARFA|nr:MarR family winged helix-turn-helix transcriptional regulator [Rarobacter faecitabidus]TQL63801.1 MarR family transcriptional regulator [Rarobacter faecitabidus]